MKEFTACLALVITFVMLSNYAVDAWDRSYWPNLTVIDQQYKTIIVDLDDELTIGTDIANEMAGQAILNVCEGGYSVMVRNWDAIMPYEVIDKARAVQLANPDLDWEIAYTTSKNGRIDAHINTKQYNQRMVN